MRAPPAAAAAALQQRDAGLVVGDRLQAGGQSRGAPPVARRPTAARIGVDDAGRPQGQPLVQGRDRQPFHTGVEQRAADLDRAVAVGVGLDHRDHLLIVPGHRAQQGQVAAQGRVVDLDPGPMRARAPGRRRVHDDRPPRSCSIASGSRAARSRAITPARPIRSLGQQAGGAVHRHAAGRRHRAAEQPAARNAPIAPASTSPLPCGRQARRGDVRAEELPVGRGDDGAGALQHHHLAASCTAAAAAASARAASSSASDTSARLLAAGGRTRPGAG